ncbi:MAG: 50S ribosomal protein L9 [Acidobacteria bacterium]|nr:50S ribosomal protein L9 [Acidobacteriota bacterium]
MEVILLQDVDKLGHRGQIVNVANGYGRNYLLPRKIAVQATIQNRKWADQQRVKFLKQTASEKAEAQELAALVEQVSLSFTRKSGEHGQLFGSVTALDLAEALSARGFHIDKRKIQLDPPIKLIGEYQVPVKLHREVTAHFKVKVEGEAEARAATPAPAEAAAAQPEANE